MNRAAQAIQGAIEALKEGKGFSEWRKSEENLKYLAATAEEVWDMAIFSLYTFMKEEDYYAD